MNFARTKVFTIVLRPEPHFHDVDGACKWCLVVQKVPRQFPDVDPKVTVETVVGTFFIGIEQTPFCDFAGMTTTLQHVFVPLEVTAQDQLRTMSSSKE